ncbi:MAG: hypothetical protein LBP81_01025, partial [Treponema sp.]|nr:hypothetical protein [Treponema sp.]
SPDGGTLSYQWYSNTTNSYTDGTPIANETGNTYTPIITSDGTTYYWVKVTNTIADNNDGGNKTATLQSSIVSIVVSSVPLVEKIEAGGSSTPVYRFTPKSGKTWSDYKEITFTVMVTDEDTYGKSARAYVAGNYAASVFGTTGENGVYSNWNAARLVKITDGTAVSTLLGDCGLSTWKTLAYPVVLEDLNNDQKDSAYVPDTYYPGSEDTGPFYFGLGLTLNQNNVSGTISYYIKDVALVESGGDKLYADNINTAFDSTTLGQLKCIFHNTSGVVIRTQEPDPSEK